MAGSSGWPGASEASPAGSGHAGSRVPEAGHAQTGIAEAAPAQTPAAGTEAAGTSDAGTGHAETRPAGTGAVTGGAAEAGLAGVTAGVAEVRRYGPGVPGAAPAGVTAEEVWRAGLPGAGLPGAGPAGRWKRGRRWAGTGLSVALIIASVVVIWLRTHHGPLEVSGAAITGQAKSGCAVDVNGRISTNGGSGTVSYEWVFTPPASAPQALRQTVAAGQDAVYVTAVVRGSGTGTLAQQVTLRVLGPGRASATDRVVVSC